MTKLAVALLAAGGVALAAPAHAQGFWFGIGPFGFGVGAAPYAYPYEPYWGGPYVYEPPVTTEYVAPAYTFAAPPYETEYAYAPEYTYGAAYRYTIPHYSHSNYAYVPEYSYPRSVARVSEPRGTRSWHITQATTRYTSHPARRHAARLAHLGEAYGAQASVPMHHVARHKRIEIRHETR